MREPQGSLVNKTGREVQSPQIYEACGSAKEFN